MMVDDRYVEVAKLLGVFPVATETAFERRPAAPR